VEGANLERDPFWSAPLRLDSLPAQHEGYLQMTSFAVLPQGPPGSDQVHASWKMARGTVVLLSRYGSFATTVEIQVSGDVARGLLRNFYDVVDGSPNPGVEVSARRVACMRGG
jgi:hypothetical protein